MARARSALFAVPVFVVALFGFWGAAAVGANSNGPDAIIYLSFEQPRLVRGVGWVDDSDIVVFTGTAGPDTSGTFERLIDGSDVQLKSAGEDIDALTVYEDGNVAISTIGNVGVPGLNAKDEDLIALEATSFGDDTAGTFSLAFDGSDVFFTTEDVAGASYTPFTDELYVSSSRNYNANGIRGDRDDILLYRGTTGPNTSGVFERFFDGDQARIGGEVIDGIHVRAAGPSIGS